MAPLSKQEEGQEAQPCCKRLSCFRRANEETGSRQECVVFSIRVVSVESDVGYIELEIRLNCQTPSKRAGTASRGKPQSGVSIHLRLWPPPHTAGPSGETTAVPCAYHPLTRLISDLIAHSGGLLLGCIIRPKFAYIIWSSISSELRVYTPTLPEANDQATQGLQVPPWRQVRV
jgi:hypothetical protein